MQKRYIRLFAAMLILALMGCVSPLRSYAGADDLPEISEYIQVDYKDDGLLSNEANIILHTSDGYIWIGSYLGLSRYDSTSFVTYGDDEDSPMNGISVRSLFEDSVGRLWIGSNEKGVFIRENGTFSHFDTGISNTGSVRAFAQTDEGIYIASTGGVMLVDNEMNVSRIDFADIDFSQISGMLTDKQGRLWIIDNDSLSVLNGHSRVYNADMTGYAKSDCNCIAQLDDGRIIIGTSGSEIIIISPEESFAAQTILLDDKSTSGAPDCQTINCVLEDNFGRIWVGADSGLGYILGNEYKVASGVNFTSIETIECDYEGNLWFGSSRQGIMQLALGLFNDKSLSSSLHGVTVNATQIYDGMLFAATDSGVQVVDPVTFDSIDHPMARLLKDIRVRGLFVDSKGYLWITTYMDYGVVRYKDGDYVSINTDDGLTSNKTRVCMELPNGDIAVATGGGVSIIRGTEVIKTYTQEDGLVNPVILSMCIDKAGNLYFGSDGNGIYIVSPDDKIKSFTSADGLASDVILNLKYDDVMDAVWISTGGSIAYWDAGGVHNLDGFKKGSGSIFDIVFSGDKIWILRNTSIVAATREQLISNSSDCIVFGTRDGLSDITSNSRHYIDEDGTLYLATLNGVCTIETNDFGFFEVPRRAVINSVTVDEVVYNNPTALDLPSDTHRITIQFSALNYSPGECSIEYQLIGSDKTPVVVEGDQPVSRDYTNLKGGNYIFRVAVIDPSGKRSENVLELSIKKQLAFYEHVYFIVCTIVISVALIAAIIYVSVQARTSSLLKRQKRYHSLTESALRVAAGTIDAKDSYTNGHSIRVAILAREIATRLGWSEESVENVYYTALAHDIGKIGVPDSLLTKPSKLTAEEYSIIRTHTTMGYNILKDFEGVPDIALGAKYHHERYDGTGYCEGLAGEDIPLVARIIAVADAYDAMSSSRVYRPMLPPEKVRQEIENGRGTQFDPNIAQIMLEMLDDGFDPFFEEDNQ